jgi:hypothetical protein
VQKKDTRLNLRHHQACKKSLQNKGLSWESPGLSVNLQMKVRTKNSCLRKQYTCLFKSSVFELHCKIGKGVETEILICALLHTHTHTCTHSHNTRVHTQAHTACTHTV